jgi:predicted transcriptional regulator
MATLTIDIPDALHAELLNAAEQRDIPLQDFLQVAISEEIDREKNRQEGERRYAEYARTKTAYSLDQVKADFEQRVAEHPSKNKTQAG